MLFFLYSFRPTKSRALSEVATPQSYLQIVETDFREIFLVLVSFKKGTGGVSQFKGNKRALSWDFSLEQQFYSLVCLKKYWTVASLINYAHTFALDISEM